MEVLVDGVLGGYGNVNDWDVIDSKVFFVEIFKECLLNKSLNLVVLGKVFFYIFLVLKY